jgi:membrane protease subunit (stomatin/prohibitin family)
MTGSFLPAVFCKPVLWSVEMKNRKVKWIPTYKSAVFKPNSLFIEEAIEDFLNNGGSITKLTSESGYYSAMSNKSPFKDVEEYFAEKHNLGTSQDN